MLKHLLVKNFVLIDECSLDFEHGFSAFTGETGAGKSLLIDAMCLLAGDDILFISVRIYRQCHRYHANKSQYPNPSTKADMAKLYRAKHTN